MTIGLPLKTYNHAVVKTPLGQGYGTVELSACTRPVYKYLKRKFKNKQPINA